MQQKILFVLKQRPLGEYGAWNYSNYAKGSSGLYVSAYQIVECLRELGFEAEAVVVNDNNDIDREVYKFKPTHVVIEAFWVIPEKFDILMKLHPSVKWTVRNHSKTEFLANEGSALGWALDYLRKNITVACNSIEATNDFKLLAESTDVPDHVIYLPNYYAGLHESKIQTSLFSRKLAKFIRQCGFMSDHKKYFGGELNVGCFGAIRPLKNHLTQAIAAIHAADKMGCKLFFHINSNRIEGKGDPILKNMREIFERHPVHELVEYEWLHHSEFVDLISMMDVVMQVSLSETFNIVAADAVAHGVPVLVSHEIPWLDSEYQVTPTDPLKISKRLIHVLEGSADQPWLQDDQYCQLLEYTTNTKKRWGHFIDPENFRSKKHNKH